MEMPRDVYDVFAAVARKFADMHRGTDQQRSEATRRAIATIRARIPNSERWVHKTEHSSGASPSKDAIGYVKDGPVEHMRQAPMFVFDTIDGSTKQPNAHPLIGSITTSAYMITVPPHDWLPPGPVDPPAGVTRDEMRAAIQDALTQVRNEAMASIDQLRAELMREVARLDESIKDGRPLDLAQLRAEVDAAISRFEISGRTTTAIGHQHNVKLGLTPRA